MILRKQILAVGCVVHNSILPQENMWPVSHKFSC